MSQKTAKKLFIPHPNGTLHLPLLLITFFGLTNHPNNDGIASRVMLSTYRKTNHSDYFFTILLKKDSPFELKQQLTDLEGRYIFLKET